MQPSRTATECEVDLVLGNELRRVAQAGSEPRIPDKPLEDLSPGNDPLGTATRSCEDCSCVHSRCGFRKHSRRHLYVTSYTEGFSHFVTSMTAPVASGWSGCRVGLAPTGKRRLVTAHTLSGHSRSRRWTPQLQARPPRRGTHGGDRRRRQRMAATCALPSATST